MKTITNTYAGADALFNIGVVLLHVLCLFLHGTRCTVLVPALLVVVVAVVVDDVDGIRRSYCCGAYGGNREDGKMIRKQTEQNTIQHNTRMIMMAITMTIINTYAGVDAVCIDYPACCCCYRIN